MQTQDGGHAFQRRTFHPSDRPADLGLRRHAAWNQPGHRQGPGNRPARRPRPDGFGQRPGTGLLSRNDQENSPGHRPHPLPTASGPRRAFRSGGPRFRRQHPTDPQTVRIQWRHGHHLIARHGPRGAAVRPCGGHLPGEHTGGRDDAGGQRGHVPGRQIPQSGRRHS